MDRGAFVYAIAFDEAYIKDEMKLTRYFENNIIHYNSGNVVCKMFYEILEEFNIERNDMDPSGDIQLLCKAIWKKHGKHHPVILFIDECEAFKKGENRGDWSSLCPQSAFDPQDACKENLHLILSFTPLQRLIIGNIFTDVSLNMNWFFIRELDTRYRNSDKIQQLIRFFNIKESHRCLNMSNEKEAPCVSGIGVFKKGARAGQPLPSNNQLYPLY